MTVVRLLPAALVLVAAATSAAAADDRLELWLNPSATTQIDNGSFVELDTAQRIRSDGADDTYYARIWLGREITNDVTFSMGAERRFEGDGRETRFLQQLNYPLGPLKGRTRLEHRLFSDDPRTGWRLRQRLGGALPLSTGENGWELTAHIKGFVTLSASEPGAQTGLTGIRSLIGVVREWDNLELGIGYLRQQTVRYNGRDTEGHAPFLSRGLKI